MKVLPRLDRLQADNIMTALTDKQDAPLDAWETVKGLNVQPEWNAAGGNRIMPTDEDFRSLRNGVLEIAEDCGFPGKKAKFREFDMRCSKWLADFPLLKEAGGETLRDDFWAWVATFLLPGIVLWRFGLKKERFLGGVRNTFQRLWMRATLLDRGEQTPDRWLYVEKLTEDAFVQLIERPGLSADPVLSQALAHEWVKRSEKRGNMEAVMRAAAKRLLAMNEIRMFSLLEETELRTGICAIFDHAERITMMGKEEARP